MVRRKALALATAGALLGVPLTAALAQDAGQLQETTVEAARQVTRDTNPVRLFSTPTIAVHPDDPLTAVIAAGDARNGGCGLHVTRDGGLSWTQTSESLMPDQLPFCIQRNFGPYADADFASDGTLYVALSGSSVETGHPNGPITALLARTTDLGETHETFTVAEPGPFTYTPPDGPPQQGFEQHRYSSLAVDPTNPQKVYIGWRESIGGITAPFGTVPVRSMIAVSNDGGETWSAPIDVQEEFSPVPHDAEPVFGSDVPSLVVGPGGTAYAFTKERPPRAPEGQPRPASRLFMFKSTDGGETWTTTIINEGVPYITNPSAAVDPSNGT
ncbi:MAG: glycoside hydrolase, partial [Actinomycetota bacterium]|nr:glycoside hydrolase [Actinomycetota bacterium]